MSVESRRRGEQLRAEFQAMLAQIAASDDVAALEVAASDGRKDVRLAVAGNLAAPPWVIAELAVDEVRAVREAAWANPVCPPDRAVPGLAAIPVRQVLQDRLEDAVLVRALASADEDEVPKTVLRELLRRHGSGPVIGVYWVGNASLRAHARWVIHTFRDKVDEPSLRAVVVDPRLGDGPRVAIMVELMARGGPGALDRYATDRDEAVRGARLAVLTDALA